MLSTAGVILAIILSILLIYRAIKQEVLPMQNKCIAMNTVAIGILVTLLVNVMVGLALG